MALLARRGRFEPAGANEELARAAAEAAAGQPDRARKRYAKLAKALASAPEELRPVRRAALIGGADLCADQGDLPAAIPLYQQAFALSADPARELPRLALKRLALHRLQLPHGSLATPLAFVRAAVQSPDAAPNATSPNAPGPDATRAADTSAAADAESLAQVAGWLQQVCSQGSIAARDEATAQVVAGLPGWDWPVLARASVLMQASRRGEAERFLAGAAPSGSGEVWFRWAAVLIAAGRFPQAVAAFDEALRRGAPADAETPMAPGSHSPWARGAALVGDSLLFRGIAKQRLVLSEAAQADFVAAVNHNPNDPRPRDALARLALQLGAPEVAREQFEAALTAAPSYGPARLGLALLHERAGRASQAAEDYRAALALAPRWRPARVRFGATLAAAGAYAQAVEVLRAEAGAEDGLGRIAAFHLGAALFASGDARGALGQWEAVGGDDLKPHVAMARDRVARAVLAQDPGSARVLWQRAMGEHPTPAYRGALHEAALREAAVLLLVGRDVPEARERAGKALDFARLLYATDGTQRTDRLQAMLALANGDAQAVATQVDSSSSVRERCHALAGLLLADPDRTRQAVTGLALIPQEHAGEAMPARLRALVAERGGDWRLALDGHLRSLISPAPAEAAATLVSACGGCGRENGPVFAVEDSASARCVSCLRVGLAAVLDCARRAGAVEEIEPVFAAWTDALGDAAHAAGVGTALGLLRAESGDHDAALELLTVRTPVERAAVLLRRGTLDVRRGRATRAVVDLREAVTLSPGDGPAVEALALLGEHEAFVHAGEGRLREAFDGYVASLLGDPGNPRLLHAVGLTGYRLAAGLDPSLSPEAAADAENVWSWTLGALVAGLYLPDVWGQTASVSGRALAPGQVGKARGLLIERLGEDLRALDLAAGRSGREVGAWSTRVGMELRCAEAFAQEDLRIAAGEGPARRLILGPALLRLLAERADEAPVLAAWHSEFEQAVAPYADGSKRATLTDVFGLLHPRLGAHRFLVLQGRFAEAIAALDAVVPEARDADHPALLAEALVREGERLYRARTWDGSLAVFVRAARLGVRELSAEQVRMGADCGLYASRALLSESASREQRARAVGLLEQAIELSPDTEQTEQLAAEFAGASVYLARKLAEEREHEQAVAVLRTALEAVPGDKGAGEALGVVLAEWAELLTRAARDAAGSADSGVSGGSGEGLARAVELWREAADHHPDAAYARSGLGDALDLSARQAALAGDRAAAEALMTESLSLDPDDSDSDPDLSDSGSDPDSDPVDPVDDDSDGNGDDSDDYDPAPLARARISGALLAYSVEELRDAAFAERAEVLRLALSFDDAPEVRAAMCAQWRSEAALRAEAKQMVEAEQLLREAVELAEGLAVRQEAVLELVSVYRAHAVEAAAHRRRRREALEAVGRAMELLPDDQDLQALRHSIEPLN